MIWFALLGCGGAEDPGCEGVSYASTARPVLTSWCTPCHSSAVPEAERQGAPLGIDYDTYAHVVAAGEQIRARLEGNGPVMPPGGAMPTEDADALLQWLTCGAPGEPDASDLPCATPRLEAGDVVSNSLCTGDDVQVQGTLTVDDEADVSCVCRVDGDIVVTRGEPWFGQLTEIGRDLDVSGNAVRVRLPALTALGATSASTRPRSPDWSCRWPAASAAT